MDKSTQTCLSWLHDLINVETSLTEDTTLEERTLVQYENTLQKETKPQVVEENVEQLDPSKEKSLEDLAAELIGHSSCSSNDEESNNEDILPYQPLSSENLPWPTILQYLRESDSQSSRYFSMQVSKPTVDHKKEEIGVVCQFCGQSLMPFSLLLQNFDKEPNFCCEDFKEYCILVAIYNKRMNDFRLQQRPGKIPLSTHYAKHRKTAQERALEKIRRKKKWEEQQRRKMTMLQSSSVMSMSRQTKVIHFSLSSPTCMNTGWTSSHHHEERKVALKKTRRPKPLLPPISNELVEGVFPSLLSEDSTLHKQYYNKGQLMSLFLPDNTSQWHIAIMQINLYPSIQSYLLYEDKSKGELIGYLDELGRGWIKGGQHSIRFLSTFNQCYIFDEHGRMKMWYWNELSSYSLFLPLVFKLERCLNVCYNNQNDISVTLSAQQKQQKYHMTRKVKEINSKSVDKSVQIYKADLEKLKHRFNLHLKSLQQTAKLYIADQSRLLPPLRKSRSVGTVSFQL